MSYTFSITSSFNFCRKDVVSSSKMIEKRWKLVSVYFLIHFMHFMHIFATCFVENTKNMTIDVSLYSLQFPLGFHVNSCRNHYISHVNFRSLQMRSLWRTMAGCGCTFLDICLIYVFLAWPFHFMATGVLHFYRL